jgi:Gluconate 2-dehydrogenase subunit 3
MERRDLLKFVALTALTQKLNAMPGNMMAHMQAPPPVPPASAYAQKFFSREESEFLDQVMEMIVPADAHSPGAHEAQTNLFADLMVSIGPEKVQKQWRDGIRLMREQSRTSSLDDVLHKASLNEEDPKSDVDRFFVQLKQMTVDGYYTSYIGIHKDLEYKGNAYLGAFPGCPPPEHQAG